MKTTTFQMANRLDAVDPMVLSLKQHVQGHLGDEAQFRFDICLSEALTNLVLHAQTPKPDAMIEIIVRIGSDETAVSVFDPEGAAPFDLREQAQSLAEVDVLAEGGRGLGLILECADHVDYGAMDQRNRLSLSFRART